MKTHESIYAAILRLLTPLVRLLLRKGIPFRAFADLAKRVYIDVAQAEFGIPGRKQTRSRVSVLTGLSRKEVLRVARLPKPDDSQTEQSYNRAVRVLSGWIRDARYHDADGNPAVLAADGGMPSFASLVKEYGGDVPPRSVLDELLRVGVVEQGEPGRFRLLDRAYIPSMGEGEKIGILGTDVAALIETIDHNLGAEPGAAFFQRKTLYDNLPEEAVERLRREIASRAEKFLEQTDRRLAENDRDVNPAVGGTGRRKAGLGIYWFEGDWKEGDRKEGDR
ncbi:MAG: DUF6502 family protein [Thermodesulfobacteriota bacterium]